MTMRPAVPRNPARVWGRDDLTCPVSDWHQRTPGAEPTSDYRATRAAIQTPSDREAEI